MPQTGIPSSASYIRIGTMFEPAIVSIGFAMLSEHLRACATIMIAAYTPTYSKVPQRLKDFKESVAFVKGTGLNLLLSALDDRIDPDEFRETYFEWVERQKKVQSLALSSATTPCASSTAV